MTDDEFIAQLTREFETDMELRIDESPFSSSTTDNWVARLGGLPPYIRGVTRGIMKTNGGDFQSALATAITAIKLWAAGKMPWSKNHAGHPTPQTQAKAQAALAHWDAMKGAAHGGASRRGLVVSSSEARAQRVGYSQRKTPTYAPTGITNTMSPAKGAYATGHPFHGNQHTGSIIGPHETAQQKQQKAHQTAHNSASATAKLSASQTANRKKVARQSIQDQAAIPGLDKQNNADIAANAASAKTQAAAVVANANNPAANAAVQAAAAGKSNTGATASGSTSGGGSSSGVAAYYAQQLAQQKIQQENALASATASYDAAKSSDALNTKQQAQNVEFAKAKDSVTASAHANEQSADTVKAAETNAEVSKDNSKSKLKAAQIALMGSMKAAGWREISETITVFELNRDMLGEMTPGGAGNWLPNGPTAYQDARIKKRLTEPTQSPTSKQPDRKKARHAFIGPDTSTCDKCGEPITSPIHEQVDPHASIINEPKNQSKTVMQLGQQYGSLRGHIISEELADEALGRLKQIYERKETYERGPYMHAMNVERTHRFMGPSLMSCAYEIAPDSPCGQHILAAVHATDEGIVKAVKAATEQPPGQPIPPIPRMLRAADGSSAGDVHSTNTKNIEIVSSPLEAALRAHFGEQAKATINRLMGKRGGKMLQRARADYPQLPRDQEELSTSHSTTPPGDPKLDPAAIAEELDTPQDVTHVAVDPHDVFDDAHWGQRTAELLEPHLATAAVLAAQNVKAQVSVGKTSDETGITLARSQMVDRARDAAQAVTSTTAKHIAAAIAQGVVAGEGREQVRDRVQHVFDVASSQRAQQIAQTVAMGGYNQAALTYARHLPDGVVTSKTWLSDADPSTRLEHRLAHHQTQRLNDPFQVGGASLDYPGDSTAPVDSWVNCRCSQAFA